jgi:hypothetical protein
VAGISLGLVIDWSGRVHDVEVLYAEVLHETGYAANVAVMFRLNEDDAQAHSLP